MKVAVIHGQVHHGSTYHLTQLLLEKLHCEKEDITEYTVNGMGQCVGCFQCIMKDEHLCPHRTQTEPIIQAIEAADVIVMESPNYVMGMSGQLKSFCDHMAYRWMSHRPNGEMRQKIGVAISTTAGNGAKSVTKEMATQFTWWAVGKVYQLPFVAAASCWNEVSAERKAKAEKQTDRIANAVNTKFGHVKPGYKSRFLFWMMGKMQEGMSYNPVDVAWWEKHGWIKPSVKASAAKDDR